MSNHKYTRVAPVLLTCHQSWKYATTTDKTPKMVRHWSTRLPRKRDEHRCVIRSTFHVSNDREMILRSVFLFVQVVWVILCPCHHKKTARAESVDKTCGYNLRQPTNKVNKYFVEYIALLMTQNFPPIFFVRKANTDDRRMYHLQVPLPQ